jgi:hypothetical protein
MSERFWPVAEAAQADYEALRAAALEGEPARDDLAAARFARRGLSGLIAWPSSEPICLGAVIGASRPAWSGSADPREAALGEAYGFLVAYAPASGGLERAVGR